MISELRLYICGLLLGLILKLVPRSKDGCRLVKHIHDYSLEVLELQKPRKG